LFKPAGAETSVGAHQAGEGFDVSRLQVRESENGTYVHGTVGLVCRLGAFDTGTGPDIVVRRLSTK